MVPVSAFSGCGPSELKERESRQVPVHTLWTVLLWRGLLAGGVMSAWLVWRRGQAGLADWKHLGWAGWSAATVSSAATICFIAAFKNTAVANVAIIYATAPFAAAAIAWVLMLETPGLATLAAAGLCLAGVTVMVGGWQAFVQAQHLDVIALAARAEARLPQAGRFTQGLDHFYRGARAAS